MRRGVRPCRVRRSVPSDAAPTVAEVSGLRTHGLLAVACNKRPIFLPMKISATLPQIILTSSSRQPPPRTARHNVIGSQHAWMRACSMSFVQQGCRGMLLSNLTRHAIMDILSSPCACLREKTTPILVYTWLFDSRPLTAFIFLLVIDRILYVQYFYASIHLYVPARRHPSNPPRSIRSPQRRLGNPIQVTGEATMPANVEQEGSNELRSEGMMCISKIQQNLLHLPSGTRR
jgi:hypothetical protein